MVPSMLAFLVSLPKRAVPEPITLGATATTPRTKAGFFKAETSLSLSDVVKIEAKSEGPSGSRPARTIMVCGPQPWILARIKSRAPWLTDITSIIAVIPITMPKIVRVERDLWVVKPLMAVLRVLFKVIKLLQYNSYYFL